jgi:hypothetical protein
MSGLSGVLIGLCGHCSPVFAPIFVPGFRAGIYLNQCSLVYSTTTEFGKSANKAFDSTTKMISTTTKTAPVMLKPIKDEAMKINGTDTEYGDWRDDLARDGYAVIKGAIPKERADKYADKMYSWLEGL